MFIQSYTKQVLVIGISCNTYYLSIAKLRPLCYTANDSCLVFSDVCKNCHHIIARHEYTFSVVDDYQVSSLNRIFLLLLSKMNSLEQPYWQDPRCSLCSVIGTKHAGLLRVMNALVGILLL